MKAITSKSISYLFRLTTYPYELSPTLVGSILSAWFSPLSWKVVKLGFVLSPIFTRFKSRFSVSSDFDFNTHYPPIYTIFGKLIRPIPADGLHHVLSTCYKLFSRLLHVCAGLSNVLFTLELSGNKKWLHNGKETIQLWRHEMRALTVARKLRFPSESLQAHS